MLFIFTEDWSLSNTLVDTEQACNSVSVKQSFLRGKNTEINQIVHKLCAKVTIQSSQREKVRMIKIVIKGGDMRGCSGDCW